MFDEKSGEKFRIKSQIKNHEQNSQYFAAGIAYGSNPELIYALYARFNFDHCLAARTYLRLRRQFHLHSFDHRRCLGFSAVDTGKQSQK
jgi:hypothetical protein